MRKVDDLLGNVQPDQIGPTNSTGNMPTKATSTPKTLTRGQVDSFRKAHRMLFGFGLVAFEIGSTDYKFWEGACADLSPAELEGGAEASKDFQGRWFRLTDYRMLCKASRPALPDPHSAYVEACMAPSPKKNAEYSHPIVFHAGVACGWQFLASRAEAEAYPRFSKIYAMLEKRVAAGDRLDLPVPELLEHKNEYDRNKHIDGRERFRRQMQELGLTQTTGETTA